MRVILTERTTSLTTSERILKEYSGTIELEIVNSYLLSTFAFVHRKFKK